jgi:hypothetical protein
MRMPLIRNMVLVLGMCTIAAFTPPKDAAAQSCSPACQECLNWHGQMYEACMGGCQGVYPGADVVWCQWVYGCAHWVGEAEGCYGL